MTTIILVIHLLLAIALVVTVLLQRSEGGALGIGGSAGGGGGMLRGRSQANVLTRATAVLATAFMTTSLTLAILASRDMQPRSIVDGPLTVPTAPLEQQPPAVPDQRPQQPEAPLGR